jgi:hypothetical protein
MVDFRFEYSEETVTFSLPRLSSISLLHFDRVHSQSVICAVESVIWRVEKCDLGGLCPFPPAKKCDLL